MIRPEDFPYIKALHVNDCYTYQDFDIHLHDYKPFSHLILTGKNGSGKSTILRFLNEYFVAWQSINLPYTQSSNLLDHISNLKGFISNRISTHGSQDNAVSLYQKELEKFERLEPYTVLESDPVWRQYKNLLHYSYFRAQRIINLAKVEAPSKETEFISKLNTPDSTQFFIHKFKQYLVNQKVNQAFSQLERQTDQIEHVSQFFRELEETFCKMFEDGSLQIEFVRTNYEFYIKLSDGRQLTFDTLSEGFSALVSILMDLFTRVDLIRKQVGDFSYDPCGIVLIDEPETHLHLQLQEQVLPLLTSLFPNVQFIAATHSPAVIASIKKTTIFDLTTKETRTDEVVGRSYSELMVTHFGLDNEYSTEADALIKQVNDAVNQFGDDPAKLRATLQAIYDKNSDYLSPTLKIKFELLMAEQNAYTLTHR